VQTGGGYADSLLLTMQVAFGRDIGGREGSAPGPSAAQLTCWR
jgi:hypothetical protein